MGMVPKSRMGLLSYWSVSGAPCSHAYILHTMNAILLDSSSNPLIMTGLNDAARFQITQHQLSPCPTQLQNAIMISRPTTGSKRSAYFEYWHERYLGFSLNGRLHERFRISMI